MEVHIFKYLDHSRYTTKLIGSEFTLAILFGHTIKKIGHSWARNESWTVKYTCVNKLVDCS